MTASTSPRASSDAAAPSVSTVTGMPASLELPGRQPRALQQRARLAREHLDRLAGRRLGVDRRRARCPSRCRTRAGRCCRSSAAAARARARRGRARRSTGTPRGPRRRSPAPRPRASAAASTRSTAHARLTAVGRAARIIAAPSSPAAGRRGQHDAERAADRRSPARPAPPAAGSRRPPASGVVEPQHDLLGGQLRLVDDLDRVARPGHRCAHEENLRQELRDKLVVGRHVHQERVVPPRRGDLHVAGVGAAAPRSSRHDVRASARCRSASRCRTRPARIARATGLAGSRSANGSK